MEKIATYKIKQQNKGNESCDYCEDGISEYSCYTCNRKLCFFCVKRIKDKYLCFFHWKLYQVFPSAIEEFKSEEKGGEKI
jgi:hypothetical protein